MVVVVKLRLFGRASVLQDGRRYRARRRGSLWELYDPRYPADSSRVEYSDAQYLLRIDHGRDSVVIDLPGNPVIFGWRGEQYEVAPMGLGTIRIDRRGTPVVRGSSTTTGVRFDVHAPELEPIIRELALGFALYTDTLSREARYAPGGGDPGM